MSEPSAFISYSWDDKAHKTWVRTLCERLRADGVIVGLDQWETVPGDQLPQYMERSIRENQFVLVVCTPRYKEKSDARTGGVGYEGDVMTAEVFAKANQRKFIPIWRSGAWPDAAPSWLVGKYHVDLRRDPYSEIHYADLLTTLHGTRLAAPAVGKPFSTVARSSTGGGSAGSAALEIEPIRIVGVIVDDVSQPKMDGSRGSALYAVPFRLSKHPDATWSRLFVQNWDRPPRFTSMHRPGIAHVISDRIVLDGTTLEEIEKVHRDTLKLALEETNRQHAELTERQARGEAEQAAREEAHRKEVEERAGRLKFD